MTLKAGSTPRVGGGADGGPVPPDQQSPYGPRPPHERRADTDDVDADKVDVDEQARRIREAEEAHGGSMAPKLVDETGQPVAEAPPRAADGGV
jgi:hypothetical protein